MGWKPPCTQHWTPVFACWHQARALGTEFYCSDLHDSQLLRSFGKSSGKSTQLNSTGPSRAATELQTPGDHM